MKLIAAVFAMALGLIILAEAEAGPQLWQGSTYSPSASNFGSSTQSFSGTVNGQPYNGVSTTYGGGGFGSHTTTSITTPYQAPTSAPRNKLLEPSRYYQPWW